MDFEEKRDVRSSYEFSAPSLNVPFQPETEVSELLSDCVESCDDAELFFRAAMSRVQREEGLQQLYELNEYTRPARQSLQSLRAAFQELATPIRLEGQESRFNELQERRHLILEEAIEREARYCSLPAGSKDVDYLEDLLWRASAVAEEFGHQDVSEAEEAAKSVVKGEGLLGVFSGRNLKRYFKDEKFFSGLAKQLRKVWPQEDGV